jgi:murein L,D-transpeptidase YafK
MSENFNYFNKWQNKYENIYFTRKKPDQSKSKDISYENILKLKDFKPTIRNEDVKNVFLHKKLFYEKTLLN